MNRLIEYMKIHLISLEQDNDPLDKTNEELLIVQGQILATRHLMSVAHDILNNDMQGKGY